MALGQGIIVKSRSVVFFLQTTFFCYNPINIFIEARSNHANLFWDSRNVTIITKGGLNAGGKG
jgi:hypothetical protein